MEEVAETQSWVELPSVARMSVEELSEVSEGVGGGIPVEERSKVRGA
jgi:hypothetical protein